MCVMEPYLWRTPSMNNPGHIRCADCCFTAVDHNVSEYSQRHCGKCERKETCDIRNTDKHCDKQTLKWAAIQCSCVESEYCRSLLNVTRNGEMVDEVIWTGCASGQKGDKL